MASPGTRQILYADRLETTIGTLLLIHDRDGHVRAFALWTFMTSSRVCGVFSGCIMARKEMNSL
jgi:hypothetical protein